MDKFSTGFGEWRWELTVTPKDIYEFDNVEVNSYSEINKLLSFVTQSKLDLITLLHFSELSSNSVGMFFKRAGITGDMPAPADFEWWKEFVNSLKPRISYESWEEEGWSLLDSYAEKQIYEINFDPYILDFDNNKYGGHLKIIPHKEKPVTNDGFF